MLQEVQKQRVFIQSPVYFDQPEIQSRVKSVPKMAFYMPIVLFQAPGAIGTVTCTIWTWFVKIKILRKEFYGFNFPQNLPWQVTDLVSVYAS